MICNVGLRRNKIFLLENLAMYGIYKVKLEEKTFRTIQKLHNKTTWNEQLIAAKFDNWHNYYLSKEQYIMQ